MCVVIRECAPGWLHHLIECYLESVESCPNLNTSLQEYFITNFPYMSASPMQYRDFRIPTKILWSFLSSQKRDPWPFCLILIYFFTLMIYGRENKSLRSLWRDFVFLMLLPLSQISEFLLKFCAHFSVPRSVIHDLSVSFLFISLQLMIYGRENKCLRSLWHGFLFLVLLPLSQIPACFTGMYL
jgi:hypothetical protein